MVQVENGLFIDQDREVRGEGVEKWPYPPTQWWMEKMGDALLHHSDLSLHIRVPGQPLETWEASAYMQTLVREWELYRVHFPISARLSVLWMDAGFAFLDSPLRWKEVLEVLKRSLSNWSVGLKILEIFPLKNTEDQVFRLWELGFRQLRLNLLEDSELLETGTGFESALHLVRQARKMGYRSIRALWRLDQLALTSRAKNVYERLISLRPDVVEWPDWLDRNPSHATLRKEVRGVLFPLGYEEIAPGCFALSHDLLYKAFETGDLSFGLQGYAPRYSRLFLGLGVNARSDAWNCMAHNEIAPIAYQEKIRNGELALTEGFTWDEDAALMRLHRDNLRCLGEVQWGEPEFQCPALWAALDRMAPLEREGLIERYSDKGLVLTEKGRKQWERVMEVF